MHVIKTIKFDLPIDGVKVKNVEELRDHFTIEVLELYQNGLLLKWLRSRKMVEEISQLESLSQMLSRVQLMTALCEVFKIDADDMIIAAALGMPKEKIESNFPEIIKRYEGNERDKINKELEEQYYDLVNKVDYAIYYALRLTILSNHYSSISGFNVYAQKNEFLKKKDGRIADTEYAFVDGVFKDRIWRQNTHELRQYEAFGWFLCSEFAGNYDYKSNYDYESDCYSNAYLFKSIQQQRKDCLYALTQSVEIPCLKKIFLQRCDELEKIIAVLPDNRERINGNARLEALSEKEKKLICYGRRRGEV